MNSILNIERSYNGWNWERVSRHLLYWSAWSVFYMVVNTNYSNSNDYLSWLFVELSVIPIKWIFTYVVIYWLMPKFFFTKKYLQFFFILIPWALICGTLIRYIHTNYVYPAFFDIVNKDFSFFSIKVVANTLDLIYIAALVSIIKLVQHNKKQEQKHQSLLKERFGAELQLLKNQLHPHFLFNTLNNLYGMVLTKEDNAADVIIRLSDMMSYMLYECDVPKIELRKEIKYLKNYIELEKIRYKDRLDLSFEVAGNIDNHRIAPLLLLPFIENAFKHSVAKDDQKTWINMNIWIKDHQLSFTIENNLPIETIHFETEKIKTQSGIGLQNVRKRLELLYPKQYELIIEKEDSYLVKLNLRLDNVEK